MRLHHHLLTARITHLLRSPKSGQQNGKGCFRLFNSRNAWVYGRNLDKQFLIWGLGPQRIHWMGFVESEVYAVLSLNACSRERLPKERVF